MNTRALTARVIVLLVSLAANAFAADQQVLPPQTVRIRGRCNKVGGTLRVAFRRDAKPFAQLTVQAVDMPKRNHHWGTTAVPDGLKDAALLVRLTGRIEPLPRRFERAYFVRPDIHFYWGEDFKRALAKWDGFPPASRRVFQLDIIRKEEAVEIWVDGRYFTRFEVGAAPYVLEPFTADGAEQIANEPAGDPETSRYLPLDLSAYPFRRPDAPPAKMQLGPVEQLPVRITDAGKAVDVSLARWLRQAQDSGSFYDPYYKRSAWDSVPETIIFSVPRRFYSHAHILCAPNPTVQDGQPEMTVRIARYRQAWDGAGATQADTYVRVDPDRPQGCAGIRKVGTIEIDGKQAPLYLIEVPLATGELADYLHMQTMDWREPPGFLYIELTRRMRTRANVNSGIFEKKPLGARSNLLVFGITLEKAPVKITVTPTGDIGGEGRHYVLRSDRKPALHIAFSDPIMKRSRISVMARIRSTSEVEDGWKGAVRMEQEPVSLRLDLARQQLGWHRIDLTVRTHENRTIWTQPISLAILPPERTEPADSRLGTWWFAGSHYCEPHADRVLPLVQALGFAHVTPQREDPKFGRTSEDLARYGITPSMMGRIKRRGKTPPPPQKIVEEFFKSWPGTPWAMIFHETRGPGLGIDLPPEVLGRPAPVLEGEDLKRFQELRATAIAHAHAIRQGAPGVRIMLGNGSTPFNVHWLRAKFPREHWDAVGMEMAVQTFHPEGQPTGWNLQSLWIAKRMREIYGYEDLPIASCYEFDYRATSAGALGLQRQADWYVRDLLHCMAYRMPSINIALIMDCNSSYYTSRWGSTGLCFRSPRMMPKPSYAALATAARVLRNARYRRWLETGSRSLYCLEFERPGGGLVYALWTIRGEREVTVDFQEDRARRFVEPGGAAHQPAVEARSAVLNLDASPRYVLASSPIVSVKAGAVRHEEPKFETQPLASMDKASGWRIVEKPDEGFQSYCAYKPMAHAPMTLGQTGGALSLTLTPRPKVPDLVGRYTALEPAAGPVAISGRPNVIGVWVKGNSNWGRIYFQLLDAKGRRWTSNGWGEAPRSWDMSDWEAETAINFDGWRFIWLGLPLHYPSGYYTPDFRHWRCEGDNSKHNRIAYPLKLSRLYVVMREKLVYVDDMVPAGSRTIQLKGLSVGVDPERQQPQD